MLNYTNSLFHPPVIHVLFLREKSFFYTYSHSDTMFISYGVGQLGHTIQIINDLQFLYN